MRYNYLFLEYFKAYLKSVTFHNLYIKYIVSLVEMATYKHPALILYI